MMSVQKTENKYIALLRGVNVGGQRKVSMPLLKVAFEKVGFENVSTYINSGNVIFTSEELSIEILQEKCMKLLSEKFSLDIPIAVISSDDLADALDHAPEWWDVDKNLKHNAFFVISPTKAEELISEVGEVKHEYEHVDYHGQVIFWSAELSSFSKTKWSKYVSGGGGKTITIRNANTTKKLLSLSALAE